MKIYAMIATRQGGRYVVRVSHLSDFTPGRCVHARGLPPVLR